MRKILPLFVACGLVPSARAADPAEFFEKSVRPLLVEHCLECHGGKKAGKEKVKGGLRLTSRGELLQGGDSGPAIEPGKPEKSPLVQAVAYKGDLRMPPKGKLSESQVQVLTRWVREGAVWPESGTATVVSGKTFRVTEAQRRHWAYQPVKAVTPPAVRNTAWPRTDIDRFILAGLEAKGLQPTGPADRRTLVRRVTYNLTGLPPTAEELDSALNDPSPDWFARVVDRLLASPAYGEHLGRYWLDVARYTDYYQPNPREHGEAKLFEFFESYRYRDWVVDALNRDVPFDQFITHQIAGDLLPSPKGEPIYPEGLVATGFLVLGSWDPHDADKDKIVSDIVDDQVDNIGKAFLGLTLGCARCHHHKFDPISQEDYYGLAGMFYSTKVLAGLGAKGGSIILQRVPLVPQAQVQRRQQQLRELAALTNRERRLAAQVTGLLATPAAHPAVLAGVAEATRLRDQEVALRRNLVPDPPLALAVQEGGTVGGRFPAVQDVPLHIRGSYAHLGPVVPRRLPGFLSGGRRPRIGQGSGRLELARWVAASDNPLTARVIVNRIWQHHFGEGIVRTANNFGLLGDAPSHPELLDWLAARFVADGWALKKLHRLVLLSAAFQQASTASPEALARDPDNRWFGRMNARRLPAEAIRDAMLVAAGRLDRRLGGPANADLAGPRRSLYVQTTRWDRSNFSSLFDAANPEASTEKRTVSTVAPQALFLLNHPFTQAQAKHLGTRLRAVPGSDTDRIRQAYLWLFGRPPEEVEIRLGQDYLGRAARNGMDTPWADYAHLLLCSNEFVYLD